MSDVQQPFQVINESVQQIKEIHNIPQRELQNTSLIDALKQTPNFLVEKYNEKIKNQNPSRPVRAGGVYVPPHKLRAMQQELMQKDANGIQHQRMMWQLLRKSINGIVNKVNISNIQNIVVQLFNQNILRGKGLLSKSIIKAQMASPNFTHVYAALISVINTKLPQIGNLILKRVMIQFRRAFQRNNKIVCIATTKMIAHLLNQRVLGQYAGLQLLFILLNQPTQASVQIACDFMVECGQVLSELTPAGANAIFERFKTLLHQAQISQKAQYSIQNLFAVRKTGFKQHPGVIPELDLVEPEDQITHNMDFEQQMTAQQGLNVFKFDPFYERTQEQWDAIKLQILGEQNIINLKKVHDYQQQLLEQQQAMQQQQKQQHIHDLTQQDLVNLRRTIYLIIQSTLNFEQCAHKLLKMNIAKGYEHELVDMIIECCMMERIYQGSFGFLAQRFCQVDDLYKQLFIKAFINHYNSIFKLQVNKIRNLAKLFGHLLFRFAIDWSVFQVIVLKPQTTTAAGRMFLKILFKQIAQNLGIEKMKEEFNKQQMREYYEGLFPIDYPNNLRFSINYFTSIGLGALTQDMREILEMQEQIIMSRKQKQQEQMMLQQMKEQEEMLRLMQQEEEERLRIQKERQQIELKIKKEEKQKLKYKDTKMKDQIISKSKKHRTQTPSKQQKSKNKRRQSSSSSSSNSSSSSSQSSSNSSSQFNTKNKDKIKRQIEQLQKKKFYVKQKITAKQAQIQKQKQTKRGRERERSRQNINKLKQSKKRYASSDSSSASQSSSQSSFSGEVRSDKKDLAKKQMKDILHKKENIREKGKIQKQKGKKVDEKVIKKDVKKRQRSQSSGISSSSESSSQSSSESDSQSSKQQIKRVRSGQETLKGKSNEKRRRQQSSSINSSQNSSSSQSQSSIDTNKLYGRKVGRQGRN